MRKFFLILKPFSKIPPWIFSNAVAGNNSLPRARKPVLFQAAVFEAGHPGLSETPSKVILRGLLMALLCLGQAQAAKVPPPFLLSPAGDAPCLIEEKKQQAVLPSGRLVTPWGRVVMLPPRPWGMALSPNEKTLITLNTTDKPDAISVISNLDAPKPAVKTLMPHQFGNKGGLMGAAIHPDGQTAYVSGGDSGKVYLLDLAQTRTKGEIDLNGEFSDGKFGDAFVSDLLLDQAGKILYVIDQMNYRIAAVDTTTQKVMANFPTGRNPFSVALSPDGHTLYVVNSGMFQYRRVEGYDPKDPAKTGLKFPAFGVPSKEAVEGVVVDGIRVPGLGDPNVPESFSLHAIDVSIPGKGQVKFKVKTGPKVGEVVNGYQAVGGSSPAGVLATADRVYVSNGHTDTVAVLDAVTGKLLRTVSLSPTPLLGALKGALPVGLAHSPVQHRLYVALAGLNAVAVVDTRTLKVLGFIPAGWHPSALQLNAAGNRLYVLNAKGYGSGPNAGPKFRGLNPYVGRLMRGSLSVIDQPEKQDLAKGTRVVLANNGLTPPTRKPVMSPVAEVAGHPSQQIKYVLMITKENRTFDEVFGGLKHPGGKTLIKGMETYARFGAPRTFNIKGKEPFTAVAMPNHLKLAAEFGLSDNFYVESDVSADGHRWLVGSYPNEWLETATSASYFSDRGFREESEAPGRLDVTGADSSLTPDDYLEAGAIWHHLERHGVPFFNWGEGLELAGLKESEDFEPSGARYPTNIPMPKPLFDNTSREFPTFNMNVPDKYRADQFIREFTAKYLNEKKPLPRFLNLYLPNDHGSGPNEAEGYPDRASYMADNDLALGRVIAFLSRTPFWKNMLIMVTEDDAQGGVDHVDAHRSVLMMIGPHVKRGYVSHRHTSIASIIKTANLPLGLPPLNLYDATASPLTDFLTDKPDFRPYTAVPVDKRLFDPEKARIAPSSRPNVPLDNWEYIEKEHQGN